MLNAQNAERQLFDIVEPRLTWAQENNNFTVQDFNEGWQPNLETRVKLYSQARQVYLFAKAYDVTKDMAYLEAVSASANFMLEEMYDDISAAWFTNIDRQNSDNKTGASVYDKSFAIFAMAHAYRVSNEERFLEAALNTTLFGNLVVGFDYAKEYKSRKTNSDHHQVIWSINPLMHLFEALLALYDVTKSEILWGEIEAIAVFLEAKLLQQEGYLPEYYHNVNEPLPIEDGGYIELGHQIEWAYLLYSAVDRGLDIKYRAVASQLFNFAMAYQVEHGRDGLVSRINYQGEVINGERVWWSHAELLRLTAYLVKRSIDIEINQHRFANTYYFVLNNYIDQENRGWVESISKGNRQKKRKVVGYHAVAAYSVIAELPVH